MPELFAGTLHTCVLAARLLRVTMGLVSDATRATEVFLLHRRKDSRIDGMSRFRRLKVLSDYNALCANVKLLLLRDRLTEIVKRTTPSEKTWNTSFMYELL